MWNDRTAAALQYANPVKTVDKLINSQTVRFIPVMDENGVCVSWKMWWYDLTDAEANAVYSGSVKNPDTECDIATGSPIGTKSNTYSKNVFLQDTFYVNDNLCANDAMFADLVAEQLNMSMLKLRVALNERSILFLDSNKTANVDTSRASTGMTTALGVTTVPVLLWDDQAIITKMQIIAEANRMGTDFLIMDGSNMLLSKNIAPYLGLNDQQRSFGAIYGDISSRYNADLLDMNRVTETESTFLVNPNMFGFHCSTSYGTAPVTIDSSKGLQAFRIADPMLRYRRSVLQGNRVVSEVVPVEYDIVYQKVCTGTDANGKRIFDHKWEVSFVGGMHLGPVANSGHTNIIKFVVDYE